VFSLDNLPSDDIALEGEDFKLTCCPAWETLWLTLLFRARGVPRICVTRAARSSGRETKAFAERMMKITITSSLALGSMLFFVSSATRADKAKVFRVLPNPQLEKIMRDAEISFKQVPAKEEGVTFYDYERGTFKMRLHNYGGKDLWLEAIFPAAPLETVNRWNQRTKFSRAVLVKEDEGDSVSLEVQLDCTGGVTEGMVRRLFSRFDEDVQAFSEFLKKSPPQP
jgi:hypothetical protein